MKKLIFLIAFLLIGSVFASGDFSVNIYGKPLSVQQGQTFDVVVKVKNNLNTEGTKKVECGIYLKSTVEDWYSRTFYILGKDTPVLNCIPTEKNVQTKELTISPFEEHLVNFRMTNPLGAGSNAVIHCAAFDCCYKDCGITTGTGLTGYDVESIYTYGVTPQPTCSDGIKNQDETDTDCGGSCVDCYNGYKCLVDSDCQSNNCESNICWEEDLSCIPLWQCSDWSSCVNNKRIRTCTDINKCNIFDNLPQTESACDTPVLDGRWIGKPTINKLIAPVNQPLIIKQHFEAFENGYYFLEAGIEFSSPLAISINQNTCDPTEKWYANKLIYLNKGFNDIEFIVTPNKKGKHVFHTAFVEGCGGKVLSRSDSEQIVTIGFEGEDEVSILIPIIIGAILFALIGIGMVGLQIGLPIGLIIGGVIGYVVGVLI